MMQILSLTHFAILADAASRPLGDKNWVQLHNVRIQPIKLHLLIFCGISGKMLWLLKYLSVLRLSTHLSHNTLKLRSVGVSLLKSVFFAKSYGNLKVSG